MPDPYLNQEKYAYSLSICRGLKQVIDCDKEFVISEVSSTSSGSRRRPYCSRIRKEKQKKRHGPKGK